jgi:hypothetical protein
MSSPIMWLRWLLACLVMGAEIAWSLGGLSVYVWASQTCDRAQGECSGNFLLLWAWIAPQLLLLPISIVCLIYLRANPRPWRRRS